MVEEILCKPGVWSVFHKDKGGKVAAPTRGLIKEGAMKETVLKTETLSANAVKSNSIHKITCRQNQSCSQICGCELYTECLVKPNSCSKEN